MTMAVAAMMAPALQVVIIAVIMEVPVQAGKTAVRTAACRKEMFAAKATGIATLASYVAGMTTAPQKGVNAARDEQAVMPVSVNSISGYCHKLLCWFSQIYHFGPWAWR